MYHDGIQWNEIIGIILIKLSKISIILYELER